MTKQQPMCDNHPDRPAVTRYGNDAADGQGTYFKVKHQLCEECDKEFSKGKLFIERT